MLLHISFFRLEFFQPRNLLSREKPAEVSEMRLAQKKTKLRMMAYSTDPEKDPITTIIWP